MGGRVDVLNICNRCDFSCDKGGFMGLINGGFGFALGGEIWLGAFWLYFFWVRLEEIDNIILSIYLYCLTV